MSLLTACSRSASATTAPPSASGPEWARKACVLRLGAMPPVWLEVRDSGPQWNWKPGTTRVFQGSTSEGGVDAAAGPDPGEAGMRVRPTLRPLDKVYIDSNMYGAGAVCGLNALLRKVSDMGSGAHGCCWLSTSLRLLTRMLRSSLSWSCSKNLLFRASAWRSARLVEGSIFLAAPAHSPPPP
eukprot:CAMPEP_0119492824 /NCGR_PEP_ID=MMETSP1344-20130328/17258_1 /TAXON_ID=236787 /ORGANISM="Florenciella parvula, Strain CCMP2471" /LENGTH=182 /DNA_ID=CAMNT_0007528195 /DNA_START=209 /DNA_END=753 /DNA_ORIENTATION=-